MTARMTCHECGAMLDAVGVDALGDAFVDHVRARHPDWPFPDIVLRNFAAATQRLTGPTERRDSIGAVEIRAVTGDRVDEWLEFFDHDGFAGDPVNAVCYCSGAHMAPGVRLDLRSWRENRAFMVEQLRSGRLEGYLAYVDNRPAGWVNASIRSTCPAFRREDDDDAAVISVTCFLIGPPYRGHGLAAALLQRVIDDAPVRRVRWVEAYPSETARHRGSRALFAGHGFSVVDERADHVVMRLSAHRAAGTGC